MPTLGAGWDRDCDRRREAFKYSSVSTNRGWVPALGAGLVRVKGLALDERQDRDGQQGEQDHHGHVGGVCVRREAREEGASEDGDEEEEQEEEEQEEEEEEEARVCKSGWLLANIQVVGPRGGGATRFKYAAGGGARRNETCQGCLGWLVTCKERQAV